MYFNIAFIISCSILLSLPLSAQESQHKERLDSIICYVPRERYKEKKVFYYDRQGKISQIAEYQWRRGTDGWRPYSLTQCKYDAEGRNIVWEFNRLHGRTWQTSERIEAEYDEKGNISKLIEYMAPDSKSCYIYERGADGHLEEIIFQTLKNGEWETIVRYQYTCDEAGNVTSYILNEKREDKWVKVRNMRYGYDANGNKTSEARYYMPLDKSGWMLADSMTYSYDADGRITRRYRYSKDYSSKQWIAKTERVYTYDDKGGNVEMVEAFLNPYMASTKTVMEYDPSLPAAQVRGLQKEPLLHWQLNAYYLNLADDLTQYTNKIKSHRIIDLKETTAYDMSEDATFYYSPISAE
ncbi:MAG: hypothetical protein II278_04085 [Bacteroidaceae bacterium]|nr:hypothetical protein [Bacteroidaceae bacterium]